jgi:hypothetical protein
MSLHESDTVHSRAQRADSMGELDLLRREIFHPWTIGFESWWNDLLRTMVARFEGQIIAWRDISLVS